jgi:uncharacterized spore protein YtfJ
MDEHMERHPGTDFRALVDQMSERIGQVVNGRLIYGDPIERDGTTVIPVARVRFGFGGGSGRKDAEGRGGAGGGAQIAPVGFIVMSPRGAIFRRISRRMPVLPLAAIAVIGLVVARFAGRRAR